MSVLTEIAPKVDALPHMAHPQAPGTSDSALTLEQSKEALTARLTNLVKVTPVVLFMKGTPKSRMCRLSRWIVRILDDRGIMYDPFNVLTDEDIQQGPKEFADWPTFPQLWIDGELVGGLDVVREEFNANPNFLTQYSVKEDVA